jgi:hypothetical protein
MTDHGGELAAEPGAGRGTSQAPPGPLTTPGGPADDRLRQLVVLSNRPGVLADTLAYVRHFMPWLTQAVVLVPDAVAARMRAATPGPPGLELVVLPESELLAAGETLPEDHGARNALLRLRLAQRGPLEDLYLQSDDDYRPLKPVGPELFVQGGRMHSYACYDLALWRQNESSYDRVQHSSYLALSYLGAEHLCYAAHMPQVIDRELFVQAFAAAAQLSGSAAFCEWSLPINYGRFVAVDRYWSPRTFRTLGWPQHPHEWPFWRRPENLTFENFYPELYQPGELYDGISEQLDTDAAQQQAFEKIRRWYGFDLEVAKLRFPGGVNDPWRTGRRRTALFDMLRPVRKLREYLTIEERTQLVELAGAIARLERYERDRLLPGPSRPER